MRPSPKLHPTAWDALVVLCVAALAIALALFQWRGGTSQGLTAVVSVDGTEIDRVSLEDAAGEKTYQAGAYTLRWNTPPEAPGCGPLTALPRTAFTPGLCLGAGRALSASPPGSSSAWRAARRTRTRWTRS